MNITIKHRPGRRIRSNVYDYSSGPFSKAYGASLRRTAPDRVEINAVLFDTPIPVGFIQRDPGGYGWRVFQQFDPNPETITSWRPAWPSRVRLSMTRARTVAEDMARRSAEALDRMARYPEDSPWRRLAADLLALRMARQVVERETQPDTAG
jgi:hypothetical protein